MSNITERQKHLLEVTNLSPMRQELYLSLLGGEAWQMYRHNDLSLALLLDMFATPEHYKMFKDGLYDVLNRFTKAPGYTTDGVNILAAYNLAKKRFKERDVLKFDAFNNVANFMDSDDIWGIYGIDPDDDRTQMVNWLGSFMINRMYITSPKNDFTEKVTALWFQVCDVAAATVAE